MRKTQLWLFFVLSLLTACGTSAKEQATRAAASWTATLTSTASPAPSQRGNNSIV